MEVARDVQVGSEPAAPDTAAPRFRDGFGFCFGVFLTARVLLSLIAIVGVRDVLPAPTETGPLSPPAPFTVPAEPGLHNAIDGTQRRDAAWFTWIADAGYDPATPSAAFFPAYPIVIRATAILTGDGTTAAVLASNVAFLVALVVLYALTTAEYSKRIARRSVLLLSFFPTSFFFLAPYSESLYLLAIVLAFWFALRGRWLAATLAGFAAGFTRSLGVALAPALGLMRPNSDMRPGRRLGRWLAIGGTLLGPIAYAAFWLARVGTPFQPLTAQSHWDRVTRLPVWTLSEGVRLGVDGLADPARTAWTVDAILTVIVLVAAIACWRTVAPAYRIYTYVALLVPLCFPVLWRPLASFPRFAIVAFPLVWGGAIAIRGRFAFAAVLAAFAAASVPLALEFMNWGFMY